MNDQNEAATSLAKAPYVSLATYRKTGAVVATPVWCAEQDGAYFIFSAGDAGKVKRLRNSPQAQLAICDVRGRLLGPWQAASAEIVAAPADVALALAALRQKYGWQMWLADVGSKLTGRYHKRSYLRVRLQN